MSILELGTLQAELGTNGPTTIGNFTLVQIQASFSAEGQAASGTVTFTLTRPVANGTMIVPSSPLVVSLDTDGNLSATLVATDDIGTAPAGIWYSVTEQLDGAQPRDYFIFISAIGPNPVQLASLIPATGAWL